MKLRQQLRHAAEAYLALLLEAGLVLDSAFLPGSRQQLAKLTLACLRVGLGDHPALGFTEQLQTYTLPERGFSSKKNGPVYVSLPCY